MASTVCVVVSFFLTILSAVQTQATDRPIIGILCHELDHTPPNCYIAASYVKAVEASGARVVPIFLSRTPDYYKKMVNSVNGIVFPGGDAFYTTPGGYFDAARIIFNYSRQVQTKGHNFPVLGVCLGHEALANLSHPGNDTILQECKGMTQIMLPIQFKPDYASSSLYRDIPQNIVDILTKQNVTANYHSYCVRPESLQPSWHVLSLNKDGEGKDFVSSMEMDGPIVGIQFHPEKNAYEWQKPHPSYNEALLATRYFYDWLVTEARKNNHSFSKQTDEENSLIYNFSPSFSGREISSFTQKYMFVYSSASFLSVNIVGILCSLLSLKFLASWQ